MNNYIQKLIKEQFSINDLDFSDDEHEYSVNIFNKNTIDIEKTVEDILNDNNVSDGVINELNECTSIYKVKSRKEL